MSVDFDSFVFDPGILNLDPARDFIAKIPTGIDTKETLLAAVGSALRFPEYFGGNWDALSDLLRDLSWIKYRRVILLHQEVPRLDRQTLSTYLAILGDAVKNWKPHDDHELVVVFPRDAREIIAGITNT